MGLQTPTPNTKPKPGHSWTRCVTGHWAVSWECQIPAPGSPLLNRGEVPVLVVPQELRSVSPDSELLASVTRARCLLFDSHMGTPWFQRGRTLTVTLILTLEPPPVGHSAPSGSEPMCRHSHSHSQIHRCPTKPFGIPHCDGAYPQPQWDWACSAYNRLTLQLISLGHIPVRMWE